MFSLACVVVGGVHGACCLPVTWSVELELGYFIIIGFAPPGGTVCVLCVFVVLVGVCQQT
jgi:hypothetical protein